jgi:hypothetical protein
MRSSEILLQSSHLAHANAVRARANHFSYKHCFLQRYSLSLILATIRDDVARVRLLEILEHVNPDGFSLTLRTMLSS